MHIVKFWIQYNNIYNLKFVENHNPSYKYTDGTKFKYTPINKNKNNYKINTVFNFLIFNF